MSLNTQYLHFILPTPPTQLVNLKTGNTLHVNLKYGDVLTAVLFG